MKYPGWLLPKNWSRLGKGGGLTDADERRNIVFSQTLVLSLIGLIIHLFIDLTHGAFLLTIPVAVGMTLAAIVYVLNENELHATARLMFFVGFNFLFFAVAALVPRACNVNSFFPDIIVLAFILYGRNQRVLSIIFTALSVALLVILELTQYHPFGNVQLIDQSSIAFSVTNLVSGTAILLLSVTFLVGQDFRQELLLAQRQEQLVRTNKQMDRFLYSATHDLRAPLNSIKGLVMLALHEQEPRVLNQYFSMMQDRIEKLDHYIIDVLDYSRTGKDEVTIASISLRSLIEEVSDNLKYMEGASRIRFIRDFGTVDLVNTDKQRLSIILRNLLSNAVKYHDLNKQDPWVRISLERTAPHTIELIVSDNGPGIEKEYQPRVFDMFFRATTQSTGSGLGLFLVREALQKLNGTIALTSEPGQGASFRITFTEQAAA